MDDSKIYVVTHKPFELSDNLREKGYELITVGNNANAMKNDGISDRSGDTIYQKNPNYCELTAAYWIWKNVKTDIKGFCHYRRYFTNSTLKFEERKIPSVQNMKDVLEKEQKPSIILPERKYYNKSSKELYLECGYEKDLETTRQVIKEKYPDYLDEYDEMLDSNSGYLTNMMIAEAKVYDSYNEWLFDILEEVENRTDISNYTKAEARIYGYISERLVDVWVKHNKIKCIEYQSVNTEDSCNVRYLVYRVSKKINLYKKIKDLMYLWNRMRNSRRN